MLNCSILVGRITADLEVKETANGKRLLPITLAVPRCYKNEDGEYETDFVDVVVWDIIADKTSMYCKKGDLIGVKGRIQTSSYETENGEKRKITEIVAEKINFMSSKKEEKVWVLH